MGCSNSKSTKTTEGVTTDVSEGGGAKSPPTAQETGQETQAEGEGK